jgi:hypothetical protein
MAARLIAFDIHVDFDRRHALVPDKFYRVKNDALGGDGQKVERIHVILLVVLHALLDVFTNYFVGEGRQVGFG